MVETEKQFHFMPESLKSREMMDRHTSCLNCQKRTHIVFIKECIPQEMETILTVPKLFWHGVCPYCQADIYVVPKSTVPKRK